MIFSEEKMRNLYRFGACIDLIFTEVRRTIEHEDRNKLQIMRDVKIYQLSILLP